MKPLRRVPGRVRGGWIAAAAGLGTLALLGGLAAVRSQRTASPYPLPPLGPRAVVTDVPATASLGMAGPSADAFARPPRMSVALPDLTAQASPTLADLDGHWIGEGGGLYIDAKRRRACVERCKVEPVQPLVVRDITGPMIVVDIGRDRYVLLRRPDGVAVAGATLAAPIEMRRE